MPAAKQPRTAPKERSSAAHDGVTITDTKERKHLAALAGALSSYGVWARVIADGSPFLRVSNPESRYATEDVHCAAGDYNHVFRASFGVDLGTTDDIPAAARRIARLVGAD